LAPDVHKVEQEGGARLFDFGRARFYAVDATGACILSRLLALPFSQAIGAVAADYGVAEERVRDDALSLTANLAKRRLLIDRDASGCDRVARKGHVLRAVKRVSRGALRFVIARLLHAASRRLSIDTAPRAARRRMRRLLRLAWASFRLLGWQGSIRLWRQLPAPATSNPGEEAEVIAAIDVLVRQAATGVFSTPVACKERALVGWWVLRGCCGLPAELVVGFQPYPFGLHAWVECDGAVVTDDAARCESYEPIVRYA
jgi:hypothetical protein